MIERDHILLSIFLPVVDTVVPHNIQLKGKQVKPETWRRQGDLNSSPASTTKLSVIPDKAGVSQRLYSVDKHLKISHAIFLLLSDATTMLSIGCHLSGDIETKLITEGRISPRTHFHCWANQDSGNNSHRLNFFLIFLSFSRHNRPPVVSDF